MRTRGVEWWVVVGTGPPRYARQLWRASRGNQAQIWLAYTSEASDGDLETQTSKNGSPRAHEHVEMMFCSWCLGARPRRQLLFLVRGRQWMI